MTSRETSSCISAMSASEPGPPPAFVEAPTNAAAGLWARGVGQCARQHRYTQAGQKDDLRLRAGPAHQGYEAHGFEADRLDPRGRDVLQDTWEQASPGQVLARQGRVPCQTRGELESPVHGQLRLLGRPGAQNLDEPRGAADVDKRNLLLWVLAHMGHELAARIQHDALPLLRTE